MLNTTSFRAEPGETRWSTSSLGKLSGVVVCFYRFLCLLVFCDSQPKFDWVRQVWTRFQFLIIVFRLYLVRFHLILQFWFSFVNSVNVTPLDPANIFSGSLLVCSRLHSWHKIKMFLAYNHCRGSASDQGKQNSAQYEGRFFGGPKKLVLPMWFPTLLNMSLFSKCPLQI